MCTGSSANIADTLLLGTPRSLSVRTETGTSVRMTWPFRLSPRLSSSSRKPLVMTASTTSLIVPPCCARIALTSDRRARAHSHVRWGPIGPFSVP